jgi:hypothetical protein
MPADSEHAARQWIEARSRENPQAVAASTLAEQRKEKIRLECALLSLRLQREQENTELLASKEYLAAIRTFCRLSLISLKQRIDASAERVAACTTPNAVHTQLRNHHRVLDHVISRHESPSEKPPHHAHGS